MTYLGTRPPTVDEWELYEPHHRARMSFRPGLTGMWQVSGRSNITDFEEVVKLDTQYIKGVYSASVEEFLGYIKYADYVVTNSFHGTAFSVIFHKDFYVEALQKDFKPNDRVESLLCLTGLDECKVKTLEDCRLNVSRDFNFADDQIRKQYIKTKQYFERVLNEDGRSF